MLRVIQSLHLMQRDITSDADQIDNTSYETYLKGELLTYSEELLKLYAQFIVNLAREGKKSCIYDYRKIHIYRDMQHWKPQKVA